jgi:NTE family protein
MPKKITQKKVGLALSGGGARGLAHIGIIRALLDAKIPISYVAGTSMGAVVGAWFASNGEVDTLEKFFLGFKPKDIAPMLKIIRRREGIILKGQPVAKWVDEFFGDKKIENCRIPFSAVATRVKDGEEVILTKGNLADAVKASAAIPIIFNPVSVNNELLMDGGAVNPVPVDVVKKMGADFVIAADVSGYWVDISEVPLDMVHFGRLFSLISSGLSAASYQVAKKILKQADIVISPPISSFDLLDFDKAGELVRLGFYETRRALPEICKGCGCPEPERNSLEKFLDFLLSR